MDFRRDSHVQGANHHLDDRFQQYRTGRADTTQSEIRRLQKELDQLKANLTQDAPTHTPSNDVQWPDFAVFGKVSVDAIYDDKNAGLNDLLIPSTMPAGDTHQQNFELHGKNSQLGLRVGEGVAPMRCLPLTCTAAITERKAARR